MVSMLQADTAARSGFAIGDWWADPTTNELTRGASTVRIEPKAMDVLMLLARNAGRVVSREALFEAAWPGMVVGDEALTQCIIKLRRALGDDSRSPAYIETIAKRGYRLIAPIQGGVGETPPSGSSPRTRHVRAWGASIAALALLGAAVGGYFLLSNSPAPAPAPHDSNDAREAAWITVSVLPFAADGAGDEQAYLARGISDNLMTELSRLSGLRLIRTSSTTPAASGAQYVVSGSVQRERETLRVNIHLVDTRTNEQLWSERIERPYGELFAIQDEMARRVMQHLPGKVNAAERQRLAKPYTRNLEAYDWFLRGQASFLVRRTEDNEEARAFYRKAVELDPTFARAYAGLAMTYAMDSRLREPAAASAALARAFELAETARLVDPDIAEVHWALGFVHAQSRRHDQAIAALQRAIELDRSYADAYALLGGIYTYIGQPAKSIPLVRTAMRLNPHAGYLYFLVAGRAYLFENDPEQAIINLRAALMRNPVDVETRVFLAASMVAAGDRPAAKWEADEIRSLVPAFSARDWVATFPMTSVEQQQRLLSLLAAVEL